MLIYYLHKVIKKMKFGTVLNCGQKICRGARPNDIK